jgi:hypothetical protein
VGHERGRSPGAGSLTEDQRRAGNRARTRLAVGSDGKGTGLLNRSTGPAFRPESDLDRTPFGVGGGTAGSGATAGARGKDRPSDRHALSCAGGASQRRTVPAHGASLRSTTLEHAPGGRILQRLARLQRAGARADSHATWTVSEDATATAATGPNARKRVEQDHRYRTTRPSAVGTPARQPPGDPAQAPAGHNPVEPVNRASRGANTEPC